MGLLGLSAYLIEQRTKEIGIRKVLGSSVPGIISLLVLQFLKWVLIANVVAWPVAYLVMRQWLQNFAYKTSITLWIFLLAGGLAVVIAVMTIAYQSIKAALNNPVDSLRFE